jgi:hypothetical protein
MKVIERFVEDNSCKRTTENHKDSEKSFLLVLGGGTDNLIFYLNTKNGSRAFKGRAHSYSYFRLFLAPFFEKVTENEKNLELTPCTAMACPAGQTSHWTPEVKYSRNG